MSGTAPEPCLTTAGRCQEVALVGRPTAHHVAWVAAGLGRAATDAGVHLPADYLRAVACDGLRFCPQLGVSRLGEGVVIHTAPEGGDQLPILLGYADHLGRWHRDGARHHPAQPAGQPQGPWPSSSPWSPHQSAHRGRQ
ncbi:MAG: hypothetical protein ACRDZQ_04605 [Acidimicrobiales bacterium]